MTLILQHTDLTTPGSVTELLVAAGRPYTLCHLHRGHAPPIDQAAYSSIVLLGGGINVDQDDAVSYLRDEKHFIRAALARGVPILGLCLGAQLLAEALGADVRPHPSGWEVGWRDVECLTDTSVAGFTAPAVRRVSHYHRYVFDLPPGARLLARNDWWPCQAFARDPRTLALQFHPERTVAQNRELALAYDLPAPGPAAQTRRQILDLARPSEPAIRAWFAEVLGGWLTHARGP